MRDSWNPSQYERFADERSQPFFDLVGLVQPAKDMTVVDLGCGTGKLTAQLHQKLGAKETLGVDSSAAMLKQAREQECPGLRFEESSIETFSPKSSFDLIFSNAALHWVPDHERLLARLSALLAPGGQIAVQIPANHDHPSHVVAGEVASRAEFSAALGGYVRTSNVLPPETYSQILNRLGFGQQHVRLQVYGHTLASREDVVEWVKGTLLTDYQKRMPPPLFQRFLCDYRATLLDQLADDRPYFYPFKRILFWGRR